MKLICLTLLLQCFVVGEGSAQDTIPLLKDPGTCLFFSDKLRSSPYSAKGLDMLSTSSVLRNLENTSNPSTKLAPSNS